MTILPFSSMDSPIDDEMKGIIRTAILELNNTLIIPMKILEVRFEENPKSNFTAVKISVEDCLDLKEWQVLREAFVIGANCQQKISNAELRRKRKNE